jgi:hypothetical protein
MLVGAKQLSDLQQKKAATDLSSEDEDDDTGIGQNIT